MGYDLETDARRILDLARKYKRGILLSALFKNGTFTKEVFFFNPVDIQSSFFSDKEFRVYFLYSVCPAEKRIYPKTESEVVKIWNRFSR